MKKYIAVCAATFLTNLCFGETVQTTSINDIPLYDKHSVVLLDSNSQCRFIARVEKSTVKDSAQSASWSIYIKEQWCYKTNGRQERIESFHPQRIELIKELPKGSVISFQQ